jgi:hypothetical protein
MFPINTMDATEIAARVARTDENIFGYADMRICGYLYL